MKLNNFGNKGEQRTLDIFKKLGFELQSPDWIAINDNKIIFIEVKEKNQRFKNIDIEGHGLDKSQVYLRQHLYNKTGIQTLLLIFDNTTNQIFFNYINDLELGYYIDTKNGIRIYPIYNFKELDKYV